MMQRCLALAQKAAGRTAPNPMVGAVIVQDGEIVGEGFHPKAGQPHAEVYALKEAGERAKGGTLYVNLEPCNHYGRTPPCSEAVIRAGISQVIIGMIDPDQRVAGAGIDRLRQAGINVRVGVEEAACQRLNEAFVHRIRRQRPFGILKYAMTLDGKIAATTGHSAWVTDSEARASVHKLRAICDAVIVGANTVRQDNPLLTTHGLSDHNPLRVVMSRRLDLPTQAQLWDTTEFATLVLTQEGVNPQFQKTLQDRGVEIVGLPTLTPATAMAHLYDRGFLTVLWECGGQLTAAAIADQTVQKVWAFIAPKIIGGGNAPSPVGDLGFEQMTQAIRLEKTQVRRIGNDFLIEGYLQTSV
ncbi:MAG: bifunctional diaminohydroxyphosphoribosylaminopyrimidine deaminase/5-amino-6-(5-phosphoribosylamino)uracil reductase RibD [Pseudanabaenales cyanobacterium]|nr:bifunctional diaminohydroxyphosphoribosylaminopyrimidine deaminase/5-amino-6-(5-phosphoribosylamino)uracil reductase RibD [Pseudanabaenales cyanobacterium]